MIALDFDKEGGLVPAIAQDADTGEVLMLAYLNPESWRLTLETGIVHYWSLDSARVDKLEQMITQMEFKSPDELQKLRDSLETWSRLCLDGLDEMAKSEDSPIKLNTLFENQ